MRIKIIGDNNCARATRHLLRQAGFAVTEFLPADVVTQAPHSGYVITIDHSWQAPNPGGLQVKPEPGGARIRLAPAPHTPDPSSKPGHSTHDQPSALEEALPSHGGASSPASHSASAHIHFDSVDSKLETAILRHVTQLSATPVVVDRPGGVVRSERELRIIVPHTRDAKADEAAAVAVEFGVLRGLLDLASPPPPSAQDSFRSVRGRTKWWTFFWRAASAARTRFWRAPSRTSARGLAMIAGSLLALSGSLHAAPWHVVEARGANGAYLRLETSVAPDPAQGQFAMGQQTKITDGTNTLVVDPCKAQTKLYVSINQTANTQLVAGTASKKIYICSIHVVVAAATSVALVEGTGSVCATGTAGVSGFGGATAATGWNFAANGGIALGNGDAALGAEGTNADNLCLFNSGSGQVSGGISYVVQ